MSAYMQGMYTKYLLVWLLLAVVAIANGIVRQSAYANHVSDLAAHQISTVTAILATGGVVWIVSCFWPWIALMPIVIYKFLR